ncbi:MAG: T9SS type A sorting domain-containing protein [Chloroflexota bacterium]|jgi:hypothetical protein|nr:T9SS type A sorting domain-containing protein [Lentimicrobium sp.]
MKSIKFLLCLLIFYAGLSATGQSVSRSVITSAGTTQTNNGERISWTLGEPVVGTMSGTTHQLGNGFFPSMDVSVFLAEPEKESINLIEVFPNPASSLITMRNKENHRMEYWLNNTDGSIISHQTASSGDNLNLSGLANGNYFLKVTDLISGSSNTFKLLIKR